MSVVKLSVAVPAVVLILSTVAVGLGSVAGGQAAAERRRLEAIPPTGMDVLNAHACGEGETKQILVLGTEDGFSPAGSEAGFIRPGRVEAFYLPRDGAGEYDQVNADGGLTDSFKVEGQVSGGVFVIRSKAIAADSDNDTLMLGALARDPYQAGGAWILTDMLSGVRTSPGWAADGEVLQARLDDIMLRHVGGGGAQANDPDSQAVQSLKGFLNNGDNGGWLDIYVSDDTAVDFMGLALCRPPTARKGVTLAPYRPLGAERPGQVHFSCMRGSDRNRPCNPYVGDTVCSASLPVACLKPGNLPAPVDMSGRPVTNNWSGGDIAVTEPVRGDGFRTVADVDALCGRRFGPGWRVATLHDGGRLLSVSGRGEPATVTGQVWVDIADQPYGVCWARE